MESTTAVGALAALAQETRLAVFRALVRAGPEGVPAGRLAADLAIPPSTLSFHLQHLQAAGLADARREGRSIRYSLGRERLHELLWYLGEDCCQGRTHLCPAPTERIAARVAEAARAERPTVLFLCSHNSARSQIAEALLRREAGDRFDVCSGGLHPRRVHPLTLRVLREVGIDAAGARAKDLGELLGKVTIDTAIVVCEAADAECARIAPFARRRLAWPFPDPAAVGGSPARQLAAFREVRDGIADRLRTWLRSRGPRPRRRPARD